MEFEVGVVYRDLSNLPLTPPVQKARKGARHSQAHDLA